MQTLQPEPELPTLDAGTMLLETADGVGPLAALVVDHLIRHDGPVYWVDAGGRARTDHLARVAPSGRLLDRVRVARGFTAYQHHALVDSLADRTASLLVLPALDLPYRDTDARGDATRLLRSVADTLPSLARETPVLLTLTARDDLGALIADCVDRSVTHEATEFGPRFAGPGFETLVYPHGDGTVQTTLAFWARVLERRARAAEGVAVRGAY